MAQERGYQPQVAPGAPAGLPQATPASFGAGVGQGIAELGQSIHGARIRAYQIQRQQTADTEAADFNARFAAERAAADKASIDARNNAAGGAAGHADAMAAWWKARAAALTEGITDDRVRRAATQQVQEFGGRFEAAEYQFQEGARIGKLATDTQAASDVAANRARRAHDPKSYAEEMRLGRQAIEAMPGVPADVKDKLVRNHEQLVSMGFLNGVIDTNPGAIGQLLDSGAFDDVLEPAQLERLRDGATTALRVSAAAQRAEAAHAMAQERERLATARAQLETGAGTPTDWDALAGRLTAIGDTSGAATATAKGTSMRAVLAHRSDTLPEMDRRIAALDAKRGSTGLSPAEASERSGLQDLRGQSAARLEQPGGALLQYQFASGKPLAPIDPANPATLRARAADARVAAARYGRAQIEPLLPEDVTRFKDLYGSGTSGKIQVLDQLRGMADAKAIDGAARQIAGDDDGAFRIAALLSREVGRDVLRGGDTLKQQPQLWKDDKAKANFAAWYGPTLHWLGGTYRNDIYEASRAFYAQRGSEGGLTGYDAGRHAQAIETVLGRDAAGGGVARTTRGLILVPAGMKPDELVTRFARATPQDYRRASGGRHPRWANGSPMTVSEFKSLLPTMLADGIYGFRKGGQLIEDDDGGPYRIDVRKLGK